MGLLLANVHQSYSPFFLATTTIFSNAPSQSSTTLVFEDQLDPVNTWMKIDLIKTQPTRRPQCQQKLEMQQYFIPNSKFFNETGGFLIDGASFIEMKFSDPPVLKPQTQTSLDFPFP